MEENVTSLQDEEKQKPELQKEEKQKPELQKEEKQKPELQKEEKPETIPELVLKIKGEYDEKIAELETKHAAAIADRDAIIQQLISGGKQDAGQSYSFVDKINGKRNYKKW